MTRTELEDLVWELPSIKASGVDFDFIEGMTDTELRDLLKPAKPEPVEIEKPEEPAKVARIRFPAPRCVAFEYVERDGRLKRLETWEHQNAGGTWTDTIEVVCGGRVTFEGRVVSASLVLHWLRTGELVKRAPRANAKPFRASIRVSGRVVHLGYFATIAECDAAREKARFNLSLGLNPVG
jgi:hypothetical protein